MLLSSSLDSLADWRAALDRRVEQLAAVLTEHELQDADAAALTAALRQRLATDRLVLAFVAEFSRGKSELINALFFGDTGRRILPATPGRTTMCPVEMGWDADGPPSLALLPIATRSGGQPVSALREFPAHWRQLPLPLDDADELARVLEEVTRTQRVTLDEARALGFWSDEQPQDNPPRGEDDLVEVPAWRHALINYPHPLLRRGLVVIDTPGLNAIGAEPELTLALLPSAHATVFVLAADAGVSRSDLTIWRDHLGDRALERFVVLNKIDALADPLLRVEQIESQVRDQCALVARTLEVDIDRVFPLSARRALTARVQGDAQGLAESRLPALEQALMAQLLPQRSQVIGHMIEDGVLSLQQIALRRLADRRRQAAEQLVELRSLRGKSGARLAQLSLRFERDAAEFEACSPRLAALLAVQSRQLREVMHSLSSDRVREEVARLQRDSESSLLKLGAARAFAQMGERLRALVSQASHGVDEIDQMLSASHGRLNAEFGFSLAAAPKPSLYSYQRELSRIEAGYSRYFSLMQVWRLSQRGFLEHFLRMLLSRLRVVFESAAVEIELWAKTAGTQMHNQLSERRRALVQRREAFQRIQTAEGELERRIIEFESQDERLQQQASQLAALVDALRILAASPPTSEPGATTPRLALVRPPPAQPSRGAA